MNFSLFFFAVIQVFFGDVAELCGFLALFFAALGFTAQRFQVSGFPLFESVIFWDRLMVIHEFGGRAVDAIVPGVL